MKRVSWALVLLFIPVVSAWDDPQSDHEVGLVYATLAQDQQIQWMDATQFNWYHEADLVRAEISETANHIIFEVEWSDAQSSKDTQPTNFFRLYHQFEFTLRGQEMIGRFDYFFEEDFQDFNYFLLGMKDEESFDGIEVTAGWPADMVGDTGMRVEFPKQYFRDDQFVPLRQGDVLQDITLTTYDDDFGYPALPMPGCPSVDPDAPTISVRGCRWRVRDLFDDGASLGNFEVELAPEGVGHLMVRSDRPWRLSNGLATTYLFELEVHNFDDAGDDVLISAVSVPDKWQIQHPAKVRFSDEGKETVPVAVTVPFNHDHGVTQIVQIQIASKKAPSITAGISLGVIFANPAQPGGHHSTLHFHSDSEPFFSPWMNTEAMKASHEGDRSLGRFSGDTVGPFRAVPTTADWEWPIRLTPSLQMGLDFDLAGKATAEFDLEFATDIPATISASLDIVGEAGVVQMVEFSGVAQTFGGGTSTRVELEGSPTQESDDVPYGSGNLVLTIRAHADPTPDESARLVAQNDAFLITEQATLKLPLIDYHEKVDLSGLKLNSFSILGPRTFAQVNPERTVAFVFNVTNLLDDKQTLTWELFGSNVAWAEVVPATTAVPASGVGQVVVAVSPPASATQGQSAELLLLGTSQQDKDRQVFVRMTAYVELQEDIPDESDVAAQVASDVKKQNGELNEDSPGFEIAAIIAGLAALVVVLRRRD